MKYTELKNSIAEGAKGIYLFEGDDAYFRTKGEEQVKSAFLRMPELNFTSFDGENLKGSKITELVAAVRNYPFMAEKRIIRVGEFYPSESEYEQYLKPLFDDFPQTSVLIIVNAGGKKGVDLKRKKTVNYVDCNRADEETVAKWAYLTFKREGISAPYGVCENIAKYCLSDMSRVAAEVGKLVDFCGGGEITAQDVDALVYKDAEYRIYEMTNAVAYGNYSGFVTIVEDILNKGADEITVLNGLFSYFKNMFTVISSGEKDAELAKLLKMKEYGVKKSREQARNIGAERLEFLTRYVYESISGVKNGIITPKNALMNVQNTIFFAQR